MWALSLGWEDPLQQETAAHSSVLAWRSPWTDGPGGLQSMGSQKSQDRTENQATERQLAHHATTLTVPRVRHQGALCTCWNRQPLNRRTGEGNGTPLQDSRLENPRDRGAWRAAVREAAEESDTAQRLRIPAAVLWASGETSQPPPGMALDSTGRSSRICSA